MSKLLSFYLIQVNHVSVTYTLEEKTPKHLGTSVYLLTVYMLVYLV